MSQSTTAPQPPGRLDLVSDVVRSVRAARAVVVIGEAGIGKTWLGRESAGRLEADSWVVRQGRGTVPGGSIPLLALAHVVDGLAIADDAPARVGPRLIEALASEAVAASGRAVALIDDAHLMDDASSRVVAELHRRGAYRLLLTVRSGEEFPPWLRDLMVDDGTAVIRVPQLSVDETSDLAAAILGAHLEHGSARAVHVQTGGVPLLVREIVHSLLHHAGIEFVDGFARLMLVEADGVPLVAPTIAQLIDERLQAVPAELVASLEVVAVAGELTPDDVRALGLDDDVERLASRDLVEWTDLGLSLVHPMYSAVLNDAIGVLRRQEVCARLARTLDRGSLSGERAVRLAAWHLEAGTAMPERVARRAVEATVMGMQRSLSLRIAEAAFDAMPGAEFALKASLLCSLLGGRERESVLWLDRAEVHADSDEVRARVAVMRMILAFWSDGDVDAALSILEQHQTGPQSGGDIDLLIVIAASFDQWSASPEAALERLGTLAQPERPRISIAADLVRAGAEVKAGQLERGIQRARRGIADIAASQSELELRAFGTHEETLAVGLRLVGRLDEARAFAGDFHRASVELREPIAQGAAATLNGQIAILAGRPRTAQRWYTEARNHASIGGHAGILRAAFGGLAFAEAMRGKISTTADLVERAESIETLVLLNESELARARARVVHAASGLEAAHEALAAAAAREAAHGHRTAEGEILREHLLLGAPERCISRLTSLAEATDSPFLSLFARHARHAVDRNVAGIEAVADELADIGADVLAGETYLDASQLARSDVGWQRADGLLERARNLFAGCEGAVSLRFALDALTERERQVAQMAADGLTTAEIAERLGLSGRTVSNHLQRTFDKFGISSRKDLPMALSTAGPPPTDPTA